MMNYEYKLSLPGIKAFELSDAMDHYFFGLSTDGRSVRS